MQRDRDVVGIFQRNVLSNFYVALMLKTAAYTYVNDIVTETLKTAKITKR